MKDFSIKTEALPGFCKSSLKELRAEEFTLVLFGGTGSLAQLKLLPSLYRLFRYGYVKRFSIIGVGRRELTDSRYRGLLKQAVQKSLSKEFQEKKWNDFCKNIFYCSGNVERIDFYRDLEGWIKKSFLKNKSRNLVLYLAVAPDVAEKVIDCLVNCKICSKYRRGKIVLEKPFGNNKKSACEINKKLLQGFKEKQIYRIDHYLGKETVQNILFLRFGNGIFEPLWNRNNIDQVIITVAEDIGIGMRGAFYDQAGVIRDIVQNHIMQLLSLVAMEPPDSFTADSIRDEKVKVLKAVKRMGKKYLQQNVVLGQYSGYRKEASVKANSNTATYFSSAFRLNTKRWHGVSFQVITGKNLAYKKTEISIVFKKPPFKLFKNVCQKAQPNILTLVIQPQEAISLQFMVKVPGVDNIPQPVTMHFDYQAAFRVQKLTAYERLLLDCIRGDQTLFAREDEIEEMWSIIDPIIAATADLKPRIYKIGSKKI